MLRIAICDDNQEEALQIFQLIQQYQELHMELDIHAELFFTGQNIIDSLNSGNQYDIYLLDIMFPDINGLTIAKCIRKKQAVSIIIFLTSSPDYSLEAYGVKALQYILKPINSEKLFSPLEDAIEILDKVTSRIIPVNTSNGMVQIRIANITYIECTNRILYVHLIDGSIVKSRNIRGAFEHEMKALLEDSRFARPHQSFIINMIYAQRLSAHEFVMEDNSTVPISQKRYADIKKQYLNFIARQ